MLALNDKWIWDFWLHQEGEVYHAYFLQADKSLIDPELRHWHVTYGHATSTDLTHWEHLGTCFSPSKLGAWDDKTTWTGCVIADPRNDAQQHAKQWHLFYTATHQAELGRRQRIGHAVSSDLHHWQRVVTDTQHPGLILDLNQPNAQYYEEYNDGPWDGRALRDPWVIADPDLAAGTGWLMFFTARANGDASDELNTLGVVGLARSSDLTHWQLEKPVYQGPFGQLEVPQVMQIGKQWVCFFCNEHAHWAQSYCASYPDKLEKGSHYLTASHPLGPWTLAPGKFFDADNPCQRYAGKLVPTPNGLKYLAFVYFDAQGAFSGTVSSPMGVTVSQADTGHIVLSLDAPQR